MVGCEEAEVGHGGDLRQACQLASVTRWAVGAPYGVDVDGVRHQDCGCDGARGGKHHSRGVGRGRAAVRVEQAVIVEQVALGGGEKEVSILTLGRLFLGRGVGAVEQGSEG
jgi:hypothetical protein